MCTNRFPSSLFLALFLTLGFLACSAFAQGGGGSGGSGGGGVTLTTATLSLDNSGVLFNGGLPSGKATFTYSKDGLTKSLTLQLSNVDVADGDSVDVELDDAWRVGNWVQHSYTFLPVTINHGIGTLSLSTANGDAVPFMLPTAGTTSLHIWGNYTVWPGTYEVATGVNILYGMFGALTRG